MTWVVISLLILIYLLLVAIYTRLRMIHETLQSRDVVRQKIARLTSTS